MSKWALFGAHRVVRAGASAPRTTGPDGRPLLRPWRITSPMAVRVARERRAQRPQPWWPRIVGLGFLGIALIAASKAIGPVASHVAVRSSAGSGSDLVVQRPLQPVGRQVAAVVRFEWQGFVAGSPVSLVLLDAGYRELTRRDGIEGTAWLVDDDMRKLLTTGETFHWYLLAPGCDRLRKSTLASFARG